MEESKQYPFTDEEIKAIASLKRAFKKCNKMGLRFSGMDEDLYVCNKRTYHLARKNRVDNCGDGAGDYNPVAFAIRKHYSGAEMLISGSPYVDSGGW